MVWPSGVDKESDQLGGIGKKKGSYVMEYRLDGSNIVDPRVESWKK